MTHIHDDVDKMIGEHLFNDSIRPFYSQYSSEPVYLDYLMKKISEKYEIAISVHYPVKRCRFINKRTRKRYYCEHENLNRALCLTYLVAEGLAIKIHHFDKINIAKENE